MAIPVCYPGAVCIDDEEYIDGGTVNSLPADDLMMEGMEKVLAILTKPLGWEGGPPNLFKRALFWRYFKRYNWMPDKLKKAAEDYTNQVIHLEEWAREMPSRAFIIAPDEMPPANLVSRSHRKINQTVDMGYRAVEELENEIRRFLQPDDPFKLQIKPDLNPGSDQAILSEFDDELSKNVSTIRKPCVEIKPFINDKYELTH